jgi:PAS domain S-box-containing protein
MVRNQEDANSAAPQRRRMKTVWILIWRVPFLRNILLVCLSAALFFPLYHWVHVSPAFRHMLTTIKIQHAQRTAAHLVRQLSLGDEPIAPEMVSDAVRNTIHQFKADFQVECIKLYSPKGLVVFSTKAQNIGSVNTHAYFFDVVAKGRVHATVVRQGKPSSEGRLLDHEAVEIYLPIMKAQLFLGAFEIYYDITEVRANLVSLLYRIDIALVIIACMMMAFIGVILFKAGDAMLSHRRSDDALKHARDQLEKRVADRTSELLTANKELLSEILDRRQAVEKLRMSERRFRSLIETIPHCIQEIDTHGVITFANPSHRKMYGIEPKMLVGQPLSYLAADEENRNQVEAHFAYLMKHQPVPTPWYSLDRTRDGAVIQTQVDWDYQRDTQGRVEGLTAVISEITHRKKAERALRDNLNFMNTLIDTIPNPVFYKDIDGYYLGCNSAYSQTLGLAKEGILGQRLIDLPPAADGDMAWHYHNQDLLLMASTGVQIHEARVRCADGVVRDYIMYKATFEDTEGQVAGLVGIMLDISPRIEAEQRRQQLELQLQQSQKMEALGTMAGGIAHDFNNILAAMIGFSELAAADTPKDSEVHHYLERVLDAGKNAQSLVKQILTFSRKDKTEPQAIQVKPIVKEVLKLVRSSLPVNIDIDRQFLSDATVMADPVQIHQVMMNLCTNAGYAMRESGGRLTVCLEDVELDAAFVQKHGGGQPGPHIRLSVADTGQGIEPDHVNRIFDPFFTTKPKGEGTGMGLSVVHGIVSTLKGLILVDSRPDEGARFDIYLPIHDESDNKKADQVGALPTGTERVLFVDDDKTQTDMLGHMLSLLGYKVTAMNSSPEALIWFKQHIEEVDLVITDMIMPQLGGDELARNMLDLRPELPMIICTGYSEHFDEAQAKAMGIRAFVLKPLVMDKLARLIRSVLDESPHPGR